MLKKVDAFKENDIWYMRLEYEFSDETGTYINILPKVRMPYNIFEGPIYKTYDFIRMDAFANDDPFFSINEELPICKGKVIDPLTGVEYEANDIMFLVKSNVRRMTLKEIEKKLGYQIELVDKTEGE
jgi:hypothetical protein